MSRTFFSVAASLDGCIAGPDQTEETPLGVGGIGLHDWQFNESVQSEDDKRLVASFAEGVGAGIMGRKMYGPIRGEWGDRDWRGWWGDNPPYHTPIYVLTHYAHEPIEMEGGTVFHFVTGGFDEAYALARDAAGDLDIQINGGASTINQALRAGVVTDFRLSIKPVLLGDGERLFAGVNPATYEVTEVIASPVVTHLSYRIR